MPLKLSTMERESIDWRKRKIIELKQKLKLKPKKAVLGIPDVEKHLEELHRKFVIKQFCINI